MIVAIFSLAIILLLAGCAGLFSAINLVPTDLGFTYFQAGTTAISAGCMVLALGFAVKVLNRSLQRLAVPEPARAMPVDPVIDLPSLPAIETTLPHDSAPLASASLAPTIAVAGVAAATGVIAATALSHAPMSEVAEPDWLPASGEDSAAITGKLVDELERDLFAQTETLPEPPPVSTPERVADAASDFDFPLPEFALRPVLEAGNEVFPVVEIADAVHDKAGPELAAVTIEPAIPDEEQDAPVSLTPAELAVPIEPEVEDAPAEGMPPAASAPGLIHDADFAAVADEILPPLAPVSSLDVVGSYDSGGTRFTMYSDGSVVSAGPEGEQRFRSLDELRRHIDGGHA